jgi:hypothetical protein
MVKITDNNFSQLWSKFQPHQKVKAEEKVAGILTIVFAEE